MIFPSTRGTDPAGPEATARSAGARRAPIGLLFAVVAFLEAFTGPVCCWACS